MDVDALRELCRQHSLGTVVSPVQDGQPEWILDHGILRNSKADYFSIGLYAQEHGEPFLLMTQKDPALVLLLVSKIDDQDVILLSLRTEPGLIGLTNLTTTIQSTPSNYLRRHGGKTTPFIQIAMDPGAQGSILYEGAQYDWGDYYLGKTKRFLIVELGSHAEAPPGFCWVSVEAAQALLLENHLVTNDLRVSIPFLATRSVQNPAVSEALPFAGSPKLRPMLEFSPGVGDCRGTNVSFFRTETATREVRSWVQPLLVPRDEMKISLAFARGVSGRVFAIEKRTQPGLSGQQLWFPIAGMSGKAYRSVTTSAEGGRFWKYPIHIELIEAEGPRDAVGNDGGHQCWVSEERLSLLIAQPLQTSLELRMAWSLVYGGGAGA
jgi:dTDP-4-dehydro-6-deoxy-alpha-D-glucopyranose 2,3-dehydratase